MVTMIDFDSLQSTVPPITPNDEKLARDIVERAGTIGGSFIVHGVYANDIDVFMTSTEYMNKVQGWLIDQGISPSLNDNGAAMYAADGGYALAGVYNIGRVQIILVRPQYIEAYKRCTAIMQDNPGIFMDKVDRIALHRILRFLSTKGI